MMKFSLASLIGMVVLCAVAWGDDGKKLPFTVSKETTGIDNPLKEDGHPDYVRAMNEKYGKGVTAENNAFVAWLAVAGVDMLPEETRKETLQACGAENIEEGEGLKWESYTDFLQKRYQTTETWKWAEDWNRALRLWKKEDLPDLADYIEKMEKILDGMKEAFKRSQYWQPWVGASLDNQLPGSAARLKYTTDCLLMRGMLRAQEGDLAGFESDCLAAKQIARRLAPSGNFYDWVTALSIDISATQSIGRVVGTGILSADQCQKLAETLDKLEKMPKPLQCIDVDSRWLLLAFVLDMACGKYEDYDWKGGWADWSEIDLAAMQWDTALKKINSLTDRAIERIEKMNMAELKEAQWKWFGEPDAKPEPDVGRRDNETEEQYTERIAVAIWYGIDSSLASVVYRHRTNEMHNKMLRTIIGAAWYKAANGQWPEKLSDTVPQYLKQVPEDLFAQEGDKEVTYVWTDTGARVKSFGGGWLDVGAE